MKKQASAAFLLAGTAIGSGMLSLPIVLAKFGLWATFFWMFSFTGLTYLTALIRSDLNLNTFASATFLDIGKTLRCPTLGRARNVFIKLLHFALMAAYLGGFSSVLIFLLGLREGLLPFLILASTLGFNLLFFFASKRLVEINKILFLALFGTFLFLVVGLLVSTPIYVLPSRVETITWKDQATLIPILFTSFGFQGSIHSMTKFCENDRKTIRSACLWGSIIPAVVYCVWTSAILLIVANADGVFFQRLVSGESVSLGDLIGVLSRTAATLHVQGLMWIVSLFALLTSILGVGLALLDLLQETSSGRTQTLKVIHIGIITWLPALVALFWKNAFLSILNVSGIILAMIAIVIPVLLSEALHKQGKVHQVPLLESKFARRGVLVCGCGIVVLGILDLVAR